MRIDVATLIVTILLGTCGAFLAWREFLHLPQKARQEILDRLREPAADGLNWEEDSNQSFISNGMDVQELRAQLSIPDKRLWKAIQRLYDEGRIGIFLWKGTIMGDGHPQIPDGSKTVVPIIIKGALPPDMRPERSEVERILSILRTEIKQPSQR